MCVTKNVTAKLYKFRKNNSTLYSEEIQWEKQIISKEINWITY